MLNTCTKGFILIGDSGANCLDRFMTYIAMTWRTQLGNRTSRFKERQWPLKLQPEHRRMVTVTVFCMAAYSFLLCCVHIADRKCGTAGIHKHKAFTPLLYYQNIYLTLFWIHNTSHFLILPCGVASLFYNEAIQTTLLELGFHHNPGILCLHIPPTDCVL